MPLGFVIVLAVFLIAAVVTIVDSIDLTVLTIYNYTKTFTPVIPRSGRLRVDLDIEKRLLATPGRDRVIETSGFFFNVNTVFGPFPFVCFGVPDNDRDYLLARGGDRLAEGRMPAPGLAEAVVSEGIARNRHLKIGDTLSSPTDTDEIMVVPVPVKVVGILKGPTWIAFTSKQFSDAAMPFAPHSMLVTSRSVGAQRAFGASLYHTIDRTRVQVFSFDSLVSQLRHSLASMYLIMAMVNGTVIFVVSLMAGMLSNIYFTHRIAEFAVLSAIGLRRRTLMVHAVSETAILSAMGWVLGILVNLAIMAALRGTVFEPRGMLIDPADRMAYLYTTPIPISITLFAVATVAYRLSRLDPVTIIERR